MLPIGSEGPVSCMPPQPIAISKGSCRLGCFRAVCGDFIYCGHGNYIKRGARDGVSFVVQDGHYLRQSSHPVVRIFVSGSEDICIMPCRYLHSVVQSSHPGVQICMSSSAYICIL